MYIIIIIYLISLFYNFSTKKLILFNNEITASIISYIMSLLNLIETSNIRQIKKYFVKNPEKINERFHLENAIRLRNYEIIKLLLEFGANPNINKSCHYLPLSYIMAFSDGKSDISVAKVAKLLLKYGADPNLNHPKSAMYFAKTYRHTLVPLLMSCVEYDGHYDGSSRIKLLNIKN